MEKGRRARRESAARDGVRCMLNEEGAGMSCWETENLQEREEGGGETG